jgi:hypothetical protein
MKNIVLYEAMESSAWLTDEQIIKIAEYNGLCTIIEEGNRVIWFDADCTSFARSIVSAVIAAMEAKK